MIRYNLMRYIDLPYNEFDEIIKAYDRQVYDNDEDCLAECKRDYDTITDLDEHFMYYIEIDTHNATKEEITELARKYVYDFNEEMMADEDYFYDVIQELHNVRDF